MVLTKQQPMAFQLRNSMVQERAGIRRTYQVLNAHVLFGPTTSSGV